MNFKKKITEMRQQREKFLAERKTDSISVHKLLIRRALPLLYGCLPESETFYVPLVDTLIANVCKPDCSGDREKGLGKHYYCSVNFLGLGQKPSGGYLKNSCMRFSPSAGTMLEEDYTMAVTLYMAGFTEKAAEYLARAIHMISDACCLPHALGMTYFSPKKSLHQAYEDLAKSMYTDFVPEQEADPKRLHLLDNAVGFAAALNAGAEAQRPEVNELLGDTLSTIKKRLYSAEDHVTALLFKFYDDTVLAPEKARYIANGAVFPMKWLGTEASVKVTENGIMLMCGEKPFSVELGKEGECRYFRAALRSNGSYTLSPVSDRRMRIISSKNGKLISFNPNKENCFFITKA